MREEKRTKAKDETHMEGEEEMKHYLHMTYIHNTDATISIIIKSS